MEKFVVGNVQQVKTCGICYNMGHLTDMCPTLQEEPVEQAMQLEDFQACLRGGMILMHKHTIRDGRIIPTSAMS